MIRHPPPPTKFGPGAASPPTGSAGWKTRPTVFVAPAPVVQSSAPRFWRSATAPPPPVKFGPDAARQGPAQAKASPTIFATPPKDLLVQGGPSGSRRPPMAPPPPRFGSVATQPTVAAVQRKAAPTPQNRLGMPVAPRIVGGSRRPSVIQCVGLKMGGTTLDIPNTLDGLPLEKGKFFHFVERGSVRSARFEAWPLAGVHNVHIHIHGEGFEVTVARRFRGQSGEQTAHFPYRPSGSNFSSMPCRGVLAGESAIDLIQTYCALSLIAAARTTTGGTCTIEGMTAAKDPAKVLLDAALEELRRKLGEERAAEEKVRDDVARKPEKTSAEQAPEESKREKRDRHKAEKAAKKEKKRERKEEKKKEKKRGREEKKSKPEKRQKLEDIAVEDNADLEQFWVEKT